MLVLGIETSCDDTAVSLIDYQSYGAVKILAEEISSQYSIHRDYGGVVPELAARAHLENLPVLVAAVFKGAAVEPQDIDYIGVTCGPGLKGCLLMGVAFARGFGLGHSLPVIGVNHIEGHILAPFLDNPQLEFPYLALVVSGGHTEIHVVRGLGDYELIARTIDDAAGEAFDKSANLIGFEYPGGPQLAALADSFDSSPFELPKVMRHSEGFSFSGLKTAIALLVAREKKAAGGSVSDEIRGRLAFAIQDSIVDALLFKFKKAQKETGIRNLIVTGGVSANKELRRRVEALPGCHAFFPSTQHCMDNGSMIALLAAARAELVPAAEHSLAVQARWPVETLPIAAGG